MKGFIKISSILSNAKIVIGYFKAVTTLLDKVVEPLDEFSDNIQKLKSSGADE